MAVTEGHYIAALDVGTTTVRCHIVDSNARTVGLASDKVILHYPQPGYVEIDPEMLWKTCISVIKSAISDSGLSAGQITCLGISTQRSTFTTWHRETGKHFHNFITWKDLRADKLVQEWNNSLTMKSIRFGAHLLYMMTRNKRFLAGSVLHLTNNQTTLRLAWVLQNVASLQRSIREALFGTVDSWLLYRLTRGQLHITDISSASATGFYDPFTLQWASWAISLFQIPETMLPQVVDVAMDFGHVEESIFGAKIPIKCLVADQSASLFGSCCFSPGDVKVTMGTGSFLNVVTGLSAHASTTGLYPLVGWRMKNELLYVAEGASNDTGSLIEWALKIGLFSNPGDSCEIAYSVNDSDGVYFIPAFSGIGPPVNDWHAAAGFIGLKPTTTKAHMVRALLESIAFRVVQLYSILLDETAFQFTSIRVDGGVSKNDFICQLIADLTSLNVEKPANTEVSILGVAFLAGIESGIWKSREQVKKLRVLERVFEPQMEHGKKYSIQYKQWCKAVQRFKDWYQPIDKERKVHTD